MIRCAIQRDAQGLYVAIEGQTYRPANAVAAGLPPLRAEPGDRDLARRLRAPRLRRRPIREGDELSCRVCPPTHEFGVSMGACVFLSAPDTAETCWIAWRVT